MRLKVNCLHPREVNLASDCFLSKLNYRKDELRVEMGEVKTYGSLSVVLEDLLLLLERWKNISQDPAYFRYLVYLGDDDEEDNEEARKKKLERQCHLNLSDEDKQIGMAAMGFFHVFEDARHFDKLLEAVSHIKKHIHKVISSSGQDFKLKVNTMEGDGMMLEDEMVTEVFMAAAGLARATIRMLQQEYYTQDVKCRKKFQEKDVFDLILKTHGIQHVWSVLTDLLKRPSSEVEDDPTMASLLKRGHYRFKQLQPKSVMNRFGGARGICGQSARLVIMARIIRLKVIVQLWDTVKRRVTYTISTYNFGCHNVAAFVIQEELFVVLLSDPESDHFFFYVLRCEIDAEANDERLDTNSWPHPVIAREVATSGTCKIATFQILKEENGNVTWFSIYKDENSVNVVFFSPNNGEEIGREKLGQTNGNIEAIKDNSAILFHLDTAEFVVYKFTQHQVHITAKISLQTIFMELDAEKYKYKKCSFLRATFDQADFNNVVFVSPCGDLAILDLKSLAVKPIRKKLLAAFQHHQSHDYDGDDWSLLAKECDGIDNCLHEHCKRAQKHLIVNGFLFFVVKHQDSCRLVAIDLEKETTLEMCQFALVSRHGELLERRFKLVRHSKVGRDECRDTNIKMDRSATGYFVPYAFDRSVRQLDPLHVRWQDRGCLSYMWILIAECKYHLHYCPEAKTLYIAGIGDSNFVEVKFLSEDADGVRARQVKKQREVQAKWKLKGSRRH